MTKKPSLILKIIIGLSFFIVGYILVSKQITTQSTPGLNTTKIQKENQQRKIKKNETELRSHKVKGTGT